MVRLCAAICLFIALPAWGQTTYYVNGDCGDDVWTGVSPDCQAPDGPKVTIQAAIDVTVNGDEVVIADAVYTESIVISDRAINLRSANGPKACILDGEGSHGVMDITNLAAPTIEGITIANAGGGGGIHVRNTATLTIIDCVLRNNEGTSTGGGMEVSAGAAAQVIRCRFEANSSFEGGGLDTDNASSVVVSDCIFVANTAMEGGGIQGANCTIERTVFEFNVSFSGQGGGGANISESTVTDCTFRSNFALAGGGGIYDRGDLSVVNSVFCDNSSNGTTGMSGGGAILKASGAVSQIINCTFARNEAFFGSAVSAPNGSLTLVDCVLWDNRFGEPFHTEAFALVIYNDIEGGYPGLGNIDANPLFVDPDAGDFRLADGSPCIDAGRNDFVPAGVVTDFDGNPRFVDDPNTPDTGFGDPPLVDMGAFEFQPPTSETICPDSASDFVISFGGALTGDALDLCVSDDTRIEVLQSAQLTPLVPFIRLEYWAHSTLADNPITSVDYTIEGHVSALVGGGQNPNTLQTSIRKYNPLGWELVDQRGTASTTDEIITHTQATNAPDYVNAGDGEVRVKQEAFSPGDVFSPNWHLKVDAYEVTVTQ